MSTHAESASMRKTGRFFLEHSTLRQLGARQVRWTVGAAVASVALASSSVARIPELDLVPVGVGIACAFSGSATLRFGVLICGAGAAFVAGILYPGASTLSSLLAAGPLPHSGLHPMQSVLGLLAMGAFLPVLDRGSRNHLCSLESGLGLVTAGALAAWTVDTLVSLDWLVAGQRIMGGIIGGLVSSAALFVVAVRHRYTDRIPDRETIASTLDVHHRTPALAAWKLDADLHLLSPDPDTREGLAEVAAWVYRLQCTRQRLATAERTVAAPTLAARMMDLAERASAEPDGLARDRMFASMRHLERMQQHRRCLASEQARAAALSEFATVFLEEARTELTLAGVQDLAPNRDRLPEVLNRLRAYSAERANVRTTRREMLALVV